MTIIDLFFFLSIMLVIIIAVYVLMDLCLCDEKKKDKFSDRVTKDIIDSLFK